MNQNLPTVAVLAGGLSTRMNQLTEKVPKSMLEIKGRPFIDYQLKWLKKSGITNIVLCVSHLGQKILEYVKDGSSYGLQVNYAWDGKKLLGTGGAVKNALPLLGKTFYVLYGDSFLSIDSQSDV